MFRHTFMGSLTFSFHMEKGDVFSLDLCTNTCRYIVEINSIMLSRSSVKVVHWMLEGIFIVVIVITSRVINSHRQFGFYFSFVFFITIPDSNHKNVLTKIFHLRISIMMHVIPLEFPFHFGELCAGNRKKEMWGRIVQWFSLWIILSKFHPHFMVEISKRHQKKNRPFIRWVGYECDWRRTNHSA